MKKSGGFSTFSTVTAKNRPTRRRMERFFIFILILATLAVGLPFSILAEEERHDTTLNQLFGPEGPEGSVPEDVRSRTRRAVSDEKTVTEALGIDPGIYRKRLEEYSASGNDYYLGTPYQPRWMEEKYGGSADFRSPHGDPWQGFEYMQCTGFVWHFLAVTCKAGGKNVPHLGVSSPWSATSPYAGGWMSWARKNGVTMYDYDSKYAMMHDPDRKLQYGDIIWSWDGSRQKLSDDHHIGIYVGDGTTDRYWNSGVVNYNAVTEIAGKVPVVTYTVIPGMPKRVPFFIYKSSARPKMTEGNGHYNLDGIQYGVFTDTDRVNCWGQVGTLTIHWYEGYGWSSNYVQLDPSVKYYLKEIHVPDGSNYKTDPKVYDVDLTAGQTNVMRVQDEPVLGKAKIKKISANPSITREHPCYLLAGAEYGVYTDEELKNRITTLVTQENGESQEEELAIGDYFVREIKASPGYGLDTKTYPLHVQADRTTVVTSAEPPLYDTVGLLIRKIDRETKGLALGGATLLGAEFTVRYFAGYYTEKDLPKKATRTWVLRTEKKKESDGRLSYVAALSDAYKAGGDDFYYDPAQKDPVLPIGTICVEETKAPVGYTLQGAFFTAGKTDESIGGRLVRQIRPGEGGIYMVGGNQYTAHDRVIRGDFTLVKADEKTQERMAGVPFRLTSKSTGESHTFMTDANGFYSSASSYARHSYRTNDGQAKSGIWFGKGADGKISKPDDGVGALPYGVYQLEELPAEANRDKVLFSGTITIDKDAYTVTFGTIDNRDRKKPSIITSAREESTGSHYAYAGDHTVLIDTVTYDGLNRGESYVLKGVLIDQKTKRPVLDPSGKEVRAQKTFTAGQFDKGTVEVEFIFDASDMSGATLVAFEELYQEGRKVAEHKEITDADQTIFFPGIRTTAKDAKTDTHLARAEKEITLIDTVKYQNLRPNRKYDFEGILMDKKTGQPVLDSRGKEIRSKVTKLIKTSEGSVEIPFTFKSEGLEGRQIVVFESVYRNGRMLAVHADITDEDQTVSIPKIRTEAVERRTNTHLALADKNVELIDRVFYDGLIPKEPYVLRGVVFDKETGKPLGASGNVESEVCFVPEHASGTAEVVFTFDGTQLEGKSLVVFEELYIEKNRERIFVAGHTNLQDEGQTIRVPKMRTSASDKRDKDRTVPAGQKTVIVDEVSYSNLLPGQSYHVQGVLMDKETGKALLIGGREVTAQAEFKAKKGEGKLALEFAFDTSKLAGKRIVVFEKLLFNQTEIARHEDMEDEKQTVRVISPPGVVQTGDHLSVRVGSLLAVLLTCGAAAIWSVRRRQSF